MRSLAAACVLLITACGPSYGETPTVTLARLIREFFEPYRMPSESMAPTLLLGDHFYVAKTAYATRDPERGEVVVCFVARDEHGGVFAPERRPELKLDTFVRRIVGVPGDLVEIRDGALSVNGTVASEEKTAERLGNGDGSVSEVYTETLAGRSFRIARRIGAREADMTPMRIASGHYLLLGDHRNVSNDGRFWGAVRREDLIGPVLFIYYSKSDGGGIRWDRFGMAVR
jgi:signal peptidase I